jgi:hypothetical protein
LIYVRNASVTEHLAARRFLGESAESDLVVFPEPASPVQAVVRVDAFRRHPRWRLVDDAGDVPTVMDRFWAQAAAPEFARRRIFDARLAGALRHHRVIQVDGPSGDLGFERVWNPALVQSTASPG